MSKTMNKFEKRSVTAYNRLANEYDNTFDGKFTQKFKAMLVNTVKIQAGDTVLDIACGNGRLLKLFADRYTFNGYGTDISDKMIEQAKALNPSMMFSVNRCEELPMADSAFDIITVCVAYHHFPDVHNFAKEAYRVLKEHGQIYIAEIYYPSVIRGICNPFIRFSKAGDVQFYSPDEIIKTLKDVGFKNERYMKNGHVQIVTASRY
jgi:ubiquinone/menaquinone biosynthesis C-methylase UbiE